MPAEERAVCDRLRKFRESKGLTRAEFARLVGMDARLLASYEMAHSQLNYPAAFQILTRFPELNPEWLAGQGNIMVMLQPVTYHSPEETGHGPRTLFSFIYNEFLKARIGRAPGAWLKYESAPFPEFRFSEDVYGRLRAEAVFQSWLRRWLAKVSDEKGNEFLNALKRYVEGALLKKRYGASRVSDEIWRERIAEVERLHLKYQAAFIGVGMASGIAKGKEREKKYLTDTATHATLQIVKPQLPSLLDDLNRMTKESGKMSELAAYLTKATRKRVPLASVSRWLSGKREPGGEITLLLRNWVEQLQERQK